MLLESFQGSDPRHVLDDARRALGDDVLIVRSRVERRGSRTFAEVVATTPRDLEALSHRLTPAPPSLPRETGGRGRSGPFIIALVGPTGSGKSTTLVKLALNQRAFGDVRVGLVTLDTFRVAALEHLQQYADIGNLALEAIYDQREVPAALARLDNCDVIVVDTPGRSPRATDANAHWQAMLAAVSPDETHLVLPSTIRPDAIPGVLATFDAADPTHLVLTKVDELPDEGLLTDVIAGTNLPLRWVTTGQAVPDDIRPARGRILSALGLGRTPTSNNAVAA